MFTLYNILGTCGARMKNVQTELGCYGRVMLNFEVPDWSSQITPTNCRVVHFIERIIQWTLNESKVQIYWAYCFKTKQVSKGITNRAAIGIISEQYFEEYIIFFLKMCILADTIQRVDTTLKLLKLDTFSKNIHKWTRLIDIGIAAKRPSFTSCTRFFSVSACLNKFCDWVVSFEIPYHLVFMKLEPKFSCCNIT